MVSSTSRRVLNTLRNTVVAGALVLAGMAQAQTGTIRLLVGFPAGGGTDVIARTLAEKLKDSLGANVIVENRAGAGGQIAAQALKAAPADGTTFFLSHDHTISILPLVTKNPGFRSGEGFRRGGRLRHLRQCVRRVGRHARQVHERVRGLGAQHRAARATSVCRHPPRCPSSWSS